MKYRLGLDLGSTSLGWCVLKLDKDGEISGFENAGVRIFHDGRNEKDHKPLAVTRREARGIRRNRDRYKMRRERLMNALVNFGMMPADVKERKKLELLDPYELRAKGIKSKLTAYELGRALFHINQRRGFKSNRKSDRKEGSEKGKIALAAERMKEELAKKGFSTIGELFYDRHKNGESVRVRMIEDGYDVYPLREMYEDEVNKLFEQQKKHISFIAGKAEKEIKDIIFFQRDLRAQEVGFCEFEDGKKRIAKAHPFFQEFRIEQEVNNLETDGTTGEYLSEDHRKAIKEALKNCAGASKKGEVSFDKLKKAAGLGRKAKFNFESEKRKGLKCDTTRLRMSEESRFGDKWEKMGEDNRKAAVEWLVSDKKDEEVKVWLKKTFYLDDITTDRVMDAPLEEGYASLSAEAILKILPHMREGKRYDEACVLAGYHHSDRRQKEAMPFLPYYGEAMPKKVIGGTNSPKDRDFPEKYYGKINNPSVHIALNQLRKIVNALIKKYGHPAEIAIEMARELKAGTQGIIEMEKKQAENQRENERINAVLKKQELPENGENRLRYKLWEDLAEKPQNRRCVFTGKQISVKDIWSDKFEIEHLLPFSRTYDDGRGNKTLCTREANRKKKNMTPFEAFGGSKEWPEILNRVKNLPEKMRWRFGEDAMKRFEEQDGGAIARMLNDTRYMSKTAKEYLGFICNPDSIDVTPGQLTAILRGTWGLNFYKDKGNPAAYRADHRHHVVDAFVVGCTTRGMLQLASKCSEWADKAGGQHEGRVKLFKGRFEPYAGFDKEERENLKNMLDKIVVSYKPDHKGAEKAVKYHSTTGSLHQDTAYGPTDIKPEKEGNIVVSIRKDITGVKEKDIEQIADKGLAKEVGKIIKNIGESGRIKALTEYGEKHNIRKTKFLIEKNRDTLIPVYKKDADGKTVSTPYKYYESGSNYCLDVYCLRTDEKRDVKNAGKWLAEVIPTFEVFRPCFEPEWRKQHPTAKRIMRLFIDDTVACSFNQEEIKDLPDSIKKFVESDAKKQVGDVNVIFRVQKMTKKKVGNYVNLIHHSVAKEIAENISWEVSANGLYKYCARKVNINEIGIMKDYGFNSGWNKN